MARVLGGRCIGVKMRIRTERGSAEELLQDRRFDQPTVVVAELTEPTVVLGSSQHSDVLDAVALEKANVTVTTRSSGGGAVLLMPGEHLWIDVSWPTRTSDQRGIESSFRWAGGLFRSALASQGVEASMSEGSGRSDVHARRMCFAGFGHGELSVDGAKVVGLSQRRRRHQITIQALCMVEWHHRDLMTLLAGSTSELESTLIIDGALPVQPDSLSDAVVEAFASANLP
jgi:lipoate-protein ligase A